MGAVRLDHVNIRTRNLEDMKSFYRRVLDFEAGPRPPFPFDGAWLYCGDKAVVHLIGVKRAQPDVEQSDLKLEHFAFSAVGMAEFLAQLRREEIPYYINTLPEFGIHSVNFNDSDGNHIHVDFAPDEEADLSNWPGPDTETN